MIMENRIEKNTFVNLLTYLLKNTYKFDFKIYLCI